MEIGVHQVLTETVGTVAASKVMSAEDAVRSFVAPGAVLGMGGQNINRCPVALTHEIVRQRIGELTVVGCNLSLPLDILVAAGLVRRTEQGSGNLERYGVLFTWRRAAERGAVEVADFSHLSMASRFLAGAMGLPLMPTRSLLGTSVIAAREGAGDARIIDDPWGSGPVVLLQALRPDVSVVHVSVADEQGNALVDGVTSHEVDMIRASKHTILSAEKVLPAGSFDQRAESVTISSAYVSAVVVQPFGAYPTSVYRRYDYDDVEIKDYQARARAGDAEVRDWVELNVLRAKDFDTYLERRDPDGAIRRALSDRMRGLL